MALVISWSTCWSLQSGMLLSRRHGKRGVLSCWHCATQPDDVPLSSMLVQKPKCSCCVIRRYSSGRDGMGSVFWQVAGEDVRSPLLHRQRLLVDECLDVRRPKRRLCLSGDNGGSVSACWVVDTGGSLALSSIILNCMLAYSWRKKMIILVNSDEGSMQCTHLKGMIFD